MKTIRAGTDMTRGPLAGKLLSLAWPVMLSFLLQTLYNLADAFWLGKLGKEALVAPTITWHVVFIGLALAMGLGTGGSTLVSQYRGAGKTDEMRRAAGQTFLLMMGAGLIIAVIGFSFSRTILSLLQTPADAFEQSLIYMRWILAGQPFMFAFLIYQNVYLGMGDTIRPLQINAITVILNVILDPILIFGFWIIPPMGVAGAAIGTFASRVIAALIGCYRLFDRRLDFHLRLPDLRFCRKMSALLLRVGGPVSLGQVGMALGFTALIGIVNTFGTAVTAAFGLGHRIIHLVMVPAFGLSQANATAVGQNLGAGNIARAQSSVRTALLMSGSILLPMTLCTFFFGAQISSLFISDPEVVSYGEDLFRITSLSVFAFGFVNVLLGSFRGSGHTVPIMVLNTVRLWAVRIPGAWLLGKHLGYGPAGIWWAMFASNTVTAILAWFWFSRGTWKKAVIETPVIPVVPAGNALLVECDESVD
jgi:putative MATE family efflux protein